MNITINLLPPEILKKELKQKNFYKIQFLGIGVILTMIFMASLSVALGVLQRSSITAAQEQLTRTEEKIADLKGTEDALLLLKNRLSVISQYRGVSSQTASMFKLLEVLIPPSVIVNAVTISKDGAVMVLATAADSLIVDELLTNITQEDSEPMLGKITVENLSRGRDGFYRISLKMKRI